MHPYSDKILPVFGSSNVIAILNILSKLVFMSYEGFLNTSNWVSMRNLQFLTGSTLHNHTMDMK